MAGLGLRYFVTNALLRFEHPLRKPYLQSLHEQGQFGVAQRVVCEFYCFGLSSDGVGKCCPVNVLWSVMIALIIYHLGMSRGASQYGAGL